MRMLLCEDAVEMLLCEDAAARYSAAEMLLCEDVAARLRGPVFGPLIFSAFRLRYSAADASFAMMLLRDTLLRTLLCEDVAARDAVADSAV